MTTNQIRKSIITSENSDLLNALEVDLRLQYGQEQIHLKGIVSIHEFLVKQEIGWGGFTNRFLDEFSHSTNFFSNLKRRLESNIDSYLKSNPASIESSWKNEQSFYLRTDDVFIFDGPITKFLYEVHKNYPNSVKAGKRFFTGSPVMSNQPDILGTIMAYEFTLKDNSDIVKRRGVEKRSLSQLRSDFHKKISEADTQLTDHLTKSNVAFAKHVKSLDELKNTNEEAFNSWFDRRKKDIAGFEEASKKKILDLEKAYDALLKLKKPAEYWNKRAKKLKTGGWIAMTSMLVLLVALSGSLYYLLWEAPPEVFTSFTEKPEKAIKWAVIYVTLISLMAYGIRTLHKLAFSSFHLSRDAEEREQLTYVYLSMINDSSISDADRKLVMQSLFSRSDTGLLKDDSGPTMPSSDIVSRIMKG